MSWSIKQRRLAAVGQPAQGAAELLALTRVEPRRRLVQAQQARTAGQGTRHSDQLARSLGQLIRHRLDRPVEVDELEDVLGVDVSGGIRVAVAGRQA